MTEWPVRHLVASISAAVASNSRVRPTHTGMRTADPSMGAADTGVRAADGAQHLLGHQFGLKENLLEGSGLDVEPYREIPLVVRPDPHVLGE